MAKTAKKAGGKIKITQVKSPSSRPGDQRATLKGLGLDKINRVSVLEDTAAVRGMIKKVAHLVIVAEE